MKLNFFSDRKKVNLVDNLTRLSFPSKKYEGHFPYLDELMSSSKIYIYIYIKMGEYNIIDLEYTKTLQHSKKLIEKNGKELNRFLN